MYILQKTLRVFLEMYLVGLDHFLFVCELRYAESQQDNFKDIWSHPVGIVQAPLIETPPETSHASRPVMSKCVLPRVTICPPVTLVSMAHFTAAL